MLILWVKALHVIFMVTWFAGLFYLPRLFVYHAMATDAPSIERFKVMEKRLHMMMNIGALFTIVFGLWMLFSYAWQQSIQAHTFWLHAKLALVLVLIAYHGWCSFLVRDFRLDRNKHSHRWYRVFNEVPTLLLFAIVILVIVRPF
jgi:protoporphyrinogen IX oxidase